MFKPERSFFLLTLLLPS
jgi:N-acetylglutamate synthase/N-acetylornithine aminotransferase